MSNPTDKASVADDMALAIDQICKRFGNEVREDEDLDILAAREAVERYRAPSPAQGDVMRDALARNRAIEECVAAVQKVIDAPELETAQFSPVFVQGLETGCVNAIHQIRALASHPDRQPTAIRRECPNCKSDALAIETDATIYCMTCGKTVGAIGLNRQPGMTDEQAMALWEVEMRGIDPNCSQREFAQRVSDAAIAAIRRASQRQ